MSSSRTPLVLVLGLSISALFVATPEPGYSAQAEAAEEEDGDSEDDGASAEEARSAESRRSPGLLPPVWKSSQSAIPKLRGPVGPSLFPSRLGPIERQLPPAPMASLSAQACNACHGEIHDQWAASGHATASTNPVYLAAIEAIGNPPECQNCHLPLENQRPTLHFGPGPSGPQSENPSYNPTLAQEGVTCAACHVRDGMIYGPRQLHSSESPHPVAQAEELRGATACAFCHQVSLMGAEEHPFIDTVGEWLRSPWGEAGIPCQQCHMPRTSGIVAGSRYAAFASHLFLGNRDPRAIRRALTLEVNLRKHELERGQKFRATATLLNTGAGHAVPTGDPSHQVELRFEMLDGNKKPAKGSKSESFWLMREVDSTAPFTQRSDSRLAAASSRIFDYATDISRKNPAGRYSLHVTVYWWAVSPERAKANGLDLDEVRIEVLKQQIPFSVF